MALVSSSKNIPVRRKIVSSVMTSTDNGSTKHEEAPEEKPISIARIEPPQFDAASIEIKGVTPYLQHKFSEKARLMMEERQRAGSTGEKSRRRHEARDFDESYRLAQHVSRDGWLGIPAPAFRNAMISACKLVGFTMTRAKLSVFVEPDGLDRDDGMPLVRIVGEPQVHRGFARNASGVADIRWRPMWTDWSTTVRVRWDARQFTGSDVFALLHTAGAQVGIGEGRPDSPKSNGLDYGRFEVLGGVIVKHIPPPRFELNPTTGRLERR